MTEPPRTGFRARLVTALAFAALAGFALNESATLIHGKSAVDSLGFVVVPLVSLGAGAVAMLIRGTAGLPSRGLLAVAFLLGMLLSGGLHEQLGLLPFAIGFTALLACLPFYVGASVCRRLVA